MRRDGIQHQMPTQREITVAPDRFEVAADDAILVTELRSAIAVCVYDAVEEAGALLHLRCIVRSPKPVDMTDSTLATELLLLDRCVESMRELAPSARNLQARVVAHMSDHPQAAGDVRHHIDHGPALPRRCGSAECCHWTWRRARCGLCGFGPAWVGCRCGRGGRGTLRLPGACLTIVAPASAEGPPCGISVRASTLSLPARLI